MKNIIVLFIAATVLSGCWNVATTSAQVVYNRENLQNTISDQQIIMQSNRALFYDTDEFKNCNISLASFRGIVIMVGQAPTPQLREAAQRIVEKMPNIRKIHNLIEIATNITQLQQMNDTWITTKIKSRLLATIGADPTQVKVVTENGTVYLMGILQPQQADIAVAVAREMSGVRRVVKVFIYLKESKEG